MILLAMSMCDRYLLVMINLFIIQEQASIHYGCPVSMIRGIELEDAGGSGTGGSHWDVRVLGVSCSSALHDFRVEELGCTHSYMLDPRILRCFFDCLF